MGVDWGWGAESSICVCSSCLEATVPGAAEVTGRHRWGQLRSSGQVGDGPSSMLAGARAFSSIPAVGLRLQGFLMKAEGTGDDTARWFLLLLNGSLLKKPRLVTRS